MVDVKLTKTDFLEFLKCENSFWLKKNKPNVYLEEELSDFDKQIIDQGIEVEGIAKKCFDGGVELSMDREVGLKETKKHIDEKTKILFEASFLANGIFARADVLVREENGSYSMYEIKSSSKVKESKSGTNHIYDATFQKIVLESAGIKISKIYIMHLNSEFTYMGHLDLKKLFKRVDVLEKVEKEEEFIKTKIKSALIFIKEKVIDEARCSCLLKTKSMHCSNFNYFNKGIDKEKSIYTLNGIREKKIQHLIGIDIKLLKDVNPFCDDLKLNDYQIKQVNANKSKECFIDKEAIKKELNNLKFPLHFLDYETAPFAIPKIEGTNPFFHIPFQFSLHKLHKNGKLEHFEFLGENLDPIKDLLNKLKECTDKEGSFVSWHKIFEKGRNVDMANLYKEDKDFLLNINERMYDLKDIFCKFYIDRKFCGSASIKNVLPIIVPELSYSDLNIKKGTDAIEGWKRLIKENKGNEELKKDLLKYCCLDTLAMVEIYKKVLEKVSVN